MIYTAKCTWRAALRGSTPFVAAVLSVQLISIPAQAQVSDLAASATQPVAGNAPVVTPPASERDAEYSALAAMSNRSTANSAS